MTTGKPPRALTLLSLVLVFLAGCSEEVNPILGSWQGTITDNQRVALKIVNDLSRDRLEIVFTRASAVVNGTAIAVVYNKNEDVYFVNEKGTNRTMNARFKSIDEIELRIPHHFKPEILSLKLTRASGN